MAPEDSVAPLHVNLVAGTGYLVIELTGELDLAGVGPTHQRFTAIARSLPDVLIVDCAGVTSLDSSALGLFTVMHREVTARNGVFTLINVDRHVGHPLVMTGLDRVLPVHWADDEPWRPSLPTQGPNQPMAGLSQPVD